MKILLNNWVLDQVDMTDPISRAGCYTEYMELFSGQEHYKLLRYLGELLKGSFIEIGTHCGSSGLCMAYNTGTDLLTYDVVDEKLKDYSDIKNIEFQVRNFFNDNERHERIISSDLIFIDASHDGELELKIYDWLVKNEYKGITIWDDIKVDHRMEGFWNNSKIKHTKIDISKYGHITGTGAILFSDDVEFILE